MSLSKTQVDRLGDRLREGQIDEADLRLLDEYRRSFAEAYEQVVKTIKGQLGLDATGRSAKSTTSVVQKLQRESIRLSQMQDIAGCRIVVDDIRRQDLVVVTLQEAYSTARVVDRRKSPSHGYRAVHVIVVSDTPVEIQIRTGLQHLWAELSEKASDRYGSDVKYGSGIPAIQDVLTKLSNFVADIEAEEQHVLLMKAALIDTLNEAIVLLSERKPENQ